MTVTGYLIETGEGISQGGRKPRLLSINDRLGLLVGLDIGATSMDMVLIRCLWKDLTTPF